MTTNFPTTLDTFTNPTATDKVSVVLHAEQHANANDAIEALQTKVGINSSADTTTHDFKLSSVPAGEKVVSSSSIDTLTNKTINSAVITAATMFAPSIDNPTITSMSVRTNQFHIVDPTVNTKRLNFNVSANSNNVTTTIVTNSSANANITLPSATETLLGRATTDTLTNKSIDVDNNTITNLPFSSLDDALVVTSTDTITNNSNDTTIPTSLAVKNYADSLAPGGQRIGFGAGTFTVTHNLGVIPSIIELSVTTFLQSSDQSMATSIGFVNVNTSTGARINGGCHYAINFDAGSSESINGGSSTTGDFAKPASALSSLPVFGTVSSVTTTTITFTGQTFPTSGIWKVTA